MLSCQNHLILDSEADSVVEGHCKDGRDSVVDQPHCCPVVVVVVVASACDNSC